MTPETLLPGGAPTLALAGVALVGIIIALSRFLPPYLELEATQAAEQADGPVASFAAAKASIPLATGGAWRADDSVLAFGGALLVSGCFVIAGATVGALLMAYFALSQLVLGQLSRRHFLLPDLLTLPLAGIGLAAAAFGLSLPAEEAILGMLGGAALVQLPRWAYVYWRAKEGFALGSVKQWAAIGAWLGFERTLYCFVGAFVLGVLVALVKIVRQRGQITGPVSFGDLSALAALVGLFWH